MYSAAEGKAWKEEGGHTTQIHVREARPLLVVVSRSHADKDEELKEYLTQLGEHQTTAIGSSLKFCRWQRARRSSIRASGRPISGIPVPAMR